MSADLTPEEARLAQALVSLVDYTGRVLLTGLAGGSPYYVADKAATLAEAAARVAELAGRAAEKAGTGGRVRMPAVARAVEARSQDYTAGRLLFPSGEGGGAAGGAGAGQDCDGSPAYDLETGRVLY